jgi:hypothetical protein
MILLINRPWPHLVCSRCAGPWQGKAHDSVSQTDIHSYMESIWVPLSRCSLKMDEVQWELLYSANPRATSRMEETSSPWSHSEANHTCEQYSLHMAKLIENSLMIAEMRKTPYPSYSPDLAPQTSIYSATWSKLSRVNHFSMLRNFFCELEQFWMALKNHIDCGFSGVDGKARPMCWHWRWGNGMMCQKYLNSIQFKSKVLEIFMWACDTLYIHKIALYWYMEEFTCESLHFHLAGGHLFRDHLKLDLLWSPLDIECTRCWNASHRCHMSESLRNGTKSGLICRVERD